MYFFILYGYFSPTARDDGYDVALYEFSTVMVVAAATTANLFNGLLTKFWTVWVFVAVFIGIVLIWIYTVRVPLRLSPRLCAAIDLTDGFLGPLFAHLPRVVFDTRLRQRLLPVPVRALLFRHLDHGHTRAGSEVPLPGVDLRLPPERLGHLELELQGEAQHGHHPRSRPVRRTGGGRRRARRAGTDDAAQHEVGRSLGASVDAGQPHRHVDRLAFAVARIQLRAGGRRRGHVPHAEQPFGRRPHRFAHQRERERAQAPRDQAATYDAPSAPSEAATWGSTIIIMNDFFRGVQVGFFFFFIHFLRYIHFHSRPPPPLSFLLHTGWTQAHHALIIYTTSAFHFHD